MTALIDALESWLSFLEDSGFSPTLNPPATEEEIAEAEQWWGFEFTGEVREFYLYTNGTSGNGLLPTRRHLMSLNVLCQDHFRKEMLSFELGLHYGDQGTPCFSIPIIASVDWGNNVFVVCDDIAAGAVSSHDEGNYWEERSLSRLFERYVSYAERGLLQVSEDGIEFVRYEKEGQMWIYAPLIQDDGNNDWRWEPIEWRTLDERKRIVEAMPGQG